MKIIVLMKQTFDTEEKVVVEGGRIKEDGVQFIINPYDEYAVEEAIRIKEAGEAEVVVLSYGPPRVEEALRKALAMGADRAILVEAEAPPADEAFVADVLARVVEKEAPDLLLAGYFSVDNGGGQVALRVAERLGLNHIGAVLKLSVDGRKVRAERDAEGDVEIVEAELPLLVTAQQGLNDPRYPSLPGIMKAKKKPLERISPADLGVERAEKTTVVDRFAPPKREAGKILGGTAEEAARELVRLLREEAKVV
ncbi:MAG: electron transfer flavoprotein subunit beta/FixA family protein [Hydrogenibacillus schlegelii]|uniref:Electron transfer flavoprotein subunit beta n=1 Tax=Hydrogenibacillus schlegelii TaxID=1484 RepID=A0A947D3Q0_HYDSH|nr:electron transfer flavoprotein subunit beta/FixA family protein [Hydrogenibacillus schlegelii]